MRQHIQKQMSALQSDYIHPEVIRKKAVALTRLLDEVKDEVRSLERQLEKEKLDVEKIQETSLTALFYKCLGKYEERLDKEKEEVLRAQFYYEEAVNRKANLEEQLKDLNAQYLAMQGVAKQIEALKEESRTLLEGSNTAESIKYKTLSQEILSLKCALKELKEAIQPGNMAINKLDEALSALGSAKNWGVYDLVGGGILADAMKHSKVDDAKRCIYEAQNYLNRFQVELKDVNRMMKESIQVSGGAVAADFFFDGLIADWYMQSKINQSSENVGKIRRQVATIVQKLEQEKASKEKLLHEKEAAINQML